ncbi:MAG: hypothetical protein KatS3mg111_2795 [Pirellulaceae bacterium]|nr:MAG: hypothetical protein KatS3mg111_2795 [Pirellulaceae bacterium]
MMTQRWQNRRPTRVGGPQALAKRIAPLILLVGAWWLPGNAAQTDKPNAASGQNVSSAVSQSVASEQAWESGGQKREVAKRPADTADDRKDAHDGEKGDVEAVMQFVRQHQPRLAKLMEYLKENDSRQYQRALREVNRVRGRLEGVAKRDPELHAVELELWKLQSRQRLLAAEAAANAERREKLFLQLEALVAKELELDLQRLELLRNRLRKQIEGLENRIEKQRAVAGENVARRMKNWRSQIEREQTQRAKRDAAAKDKQSKAKEQG